MHRFYQAQDEIEAQFLIDYLASSHIHATMLGRYQAAAAGELTAVNFPWVYLLEARDLARAKQLLEQFQAQRAGVAQADAWVCPACQTEIEAGFDLCWQCGAARES